jgi:hypothetical protein
MALLALAAATAPLAVEAGWAAGVAGNAPVVVVQQAIETEKLPSRPCRRDREAAAGRR